MVTFFCPGCWRPIAEGAATCPRCGADIAELDRQDYVTRLIAALSNPEPNTPIRAAWVLARLRARAAVGPLLEVAHGNADPYIKAAAVEALGWIGEPSARPALAALAKHGSILVRLKAEEALERMNRTSAPTAKMDRNPNPST